MRRQWAVFQAIEYCLSSSVCAHGSFSSGPGGANSSTRLVCEHLAVAGRLGVACCDARGSLGGASVGGTCVLFASAGGGIRSASAITVRGQALIYFLFPGGSGLLRIFKRLQG